MPGQRAASVIFFSAAASISHVLLLGNLKRYHPNRQFLQPLSESRTDHNIGRALDKIFETGTQKIFGQLSQNAVDGFQIKPTGAHYDTTSVSVYGDHTLTEKPFEITYGHSKDKRPAARYKSFETTVTLYETPFRAIAIHSSAHDKRRQKKKSNVC